MILSRLIAKWIAVAVANSCIEPSEGISWDPQRHHSKEVRTPQKGEPGGFAFAKRGEAWCRLGADFYPTAVLLVIGEEEEPAEVGSAAEMIVLPMGAGVAVAVRVEIGMGPEPALSDMLPEPDLVLMEGEV